MFNICYGQLPENVLKKKLVLYLVSAISADGLGHPHVLRWPEGIDTLGVNTHVKKMQLHRQNYYQTDRMEQLRR